MTDSDVQDALFAAAERAQRAPSLLNTQPWRWRLRPGELELYADRSRQVRSVDPDGRLLTLSCGAALHHARMALAASGVEVRPERMPDPESSDLLAKLRVSGVRPARPAQLQAMHNIQARRSERRPIGATGPVPEETIAGLVRAAEAEQTRLHLVVDEQLPFLLAAAERAGTAEARSPAYQADLAALTSRVWHTGEGVPPETVTSAVSRPIPVRDFTPGRETLLHPGFGDDRYASYLIVVTSEDGPPDWLRAGEAVSAVWLVATEAGLVMSVMSDVVEVPGARALLRSLIRPSGMPQLVLRVGLNTQPTPAPHTPRRTVDIDVEPGPRS